MIKYILMLFVCIFTNFVNMILRFIGLVHVYDIENGDNITFVYYILRLLALLNVSIDIVYPKLGICKYINNKYVRYICYDTNLSQINDKLNLLSKNYHDIKRIELLVKTNKVTDDKFPRIDVTNAKNNFFDLDNTITDLSDVVKFYLIMKKNTIALPANFERINSIIITRENFNDELLEFITTYTEIKYIYG
jgi:hypothetical protein